MRNVLMIAYYYPPLGGIGSQRSQKFARHLPSFGWKPIVLTPKSGSYFADPLLDDGTAIGVEVVRTPVIDLSGAFRSVASFGGRPPRSAGGHLRAIEGGAAVQILRRAVRTWIYVPDGQVGWLPYAVRAGRNVIATRGIDVIYSTSFPVTSHVAAARLKRKTGIPWIADFRDLWTENHYDESSSALRKRLDRAIESRLIAQADMLVTVSDTWAERLRASSGNRKRVEVIRNGFDAADFAGIEPSRPDKWTITYVGTFYGAKQDPSAFFAALRNLIDGGTIPRDAVRFDIVGEPDAYVQEKLERFRLVDIAHWTGFIPHAESLEHQVGSSLLLLIVHSRSANAGLVPGKLYEYLGARRPILAIVPRHFEAARIVLESRSGTTVDAVDSAGIERCLAQSYAAYSAGVEPRLEDGDLSVYERRRGAEKLANLLNEVASVH